MAKFTTTEPIDFLNFDIGDLDDGTPGTQTATQFQRVEGIGDEEDLFGTGFKYVGNNLISGTAILTRSTPPAPGTSRAS